MALIIQRVRPAGWVHGNIYEPDEVNGMDQNPVTLAEYVEAQRIDVKLYGAVGDNSTDDTSAIQDAADQAASTGSPLWFPPGVYQCSGINWGACSIYGVPNKSFLRGNVSSVPILVSDVDEVNSASIYTARVVKGLSLDFVSATPSASLITLAGSTRVLFDSCFFDNTTSSLSLAGAIQLGSASDVTKGVFRDCGFLVSGVSDFAIGHEDGETHATIEHCRFRLTSSGRSALAPLIGTTVIKVSDCYVDLSSATAGATDVPVFGESGTTQISVTGTTVTDCDTGIVEIYSGANVEVMDSGCSYPATAVLKTPGFSPTRFSMDSRRRHKEETQTGGGTMTVDPVNHDSIMVIIGDNTDFTMSARPAPLGTEFDLMLRRSASPSGTITWSSSAFTSFGTAHTGIGMPTQVSVTSIASCRFRRAVAFNGDERWVLVGSAVHYT